MVGLPATNLIYLRFAVVEGANHTRIRVGDRATVVPRHNEINEITAKHILKQIGAR